jgi:hypothetical protein
VIACVARALVVSAWMGVGSWAAPAAAQACGGPETAPCAPPNVPDDGLLALGGTLFGTAYLGAFVWDLAGGLARRVPSPYAFEEPDKALPYGAVVGPIPFFQAVAAVDGQGDWGLGALAIGMVAMAVEIVGTILLIVGALGHPPTTRVRDPAQRTISSAPSRGPTITSIGIGWLSSSGSVASEAWCPGRRTAHVPT